MGWVSIFMLNLNLTESCIPLGMRTLLIQSNTELIFDKHRALPRRKIRNQKSCIKNFNPIS